MWWMHVCHHQDYSTLLLKLLLYSETFFVKQIHCHFVVHGHNVQPVVSIYELFWVCACSVCVCAWSVCAWSEAIYRVHVIIIASFSAIPFFILRYNTILNANWRIKMGEAWERGYHHYMQTCTIACKLQKKLQTWVCFKLLHPILPLYSCTIL